MEQKSEIICSFTQKLTYNDYLNFINYIIKTNNEKTKKSKYSPINLLRLIIPFIVILTLISFTFITLTTTNNTIYMVSLFSCIIIYIVIVLIACYKLFLAKISSLETVERKFILFKDHFLYTPINCSNNKFLMSLLIKYKFITPKVESYTILMQNISEVILSSTFCALKSNDNFFTIISLSNKNPEIDILIDYLKRNYSNKIILTE